VIRRRQVVEVSLCIAALAPVACLVDAGGTAVTASREYNKIETKTSLNMTLAANEESGTMEEVVLWMSFRATDDVCAVLV
jgi:hypothetical protein